MSLKIKVYYPFHPLYGMELNLACTTKKKDGFVTISDPHGFQLKVPLWMTRSSAENFQLSDIAALNNRGLLTICEIMKEFNKAKETKHQKNKNLKSKL